MKILHYRQGPNPNPIAYHELELHFKKPNNWSIATTSHRYTGKIPRKLKKRIKRMIYFDRKFTETFTLAQRYWMYQDTINPNYNTFLIKLICQHENSSTIN